MRAPLNGKEVMAFVEVYNVLFSEPEQKQEIKTESKNGEIKK